MGVIKNIGYTMAAIFVLAVLFVGSTIVSALVFMGGILLTGAAVIAFVAYCIKDYCESKANRPN